MSLSWCYTSGPVVTFYLSVCLDRKTLNNRQYCTHSVYVQCIASQVYLFYFPTVSSERYHETPFFSHEVRGLLTPTPLVGVSTVSRFFSPLSFAGVLVYTKKTLVGSTRKSFRRDLLYSRARFEKYRLRGATNTVTRGWSRHLQTSTRAQV